jgi:hypothetical protein
MRKSLTIAAAIAGVFLFSVASAAYAGSESWVFAPNGVGIAVGTNGGLTGFHKMDERTFVQGTIGGLSNGGLVLGADYAMVFPRAIYAIPELTPYIGGGAFIFSCNRWCSNMAGVDDGTGFGARIPFGLLLQIPNAPVHIHLEVGPSTTVIPEVHSGFDAVLGARFLF